MILAILDVDDAASAKISNYRNALDSLNATHERVTQSTGSVARATRDSLNAFDALSQSEVVTAARSGALADQLGRMPGITTTATSGILSFVTMLGLAAQQAQIADANLRAYGSTLAGLVLTLQDSATVTKIQATALQELAKAAAAGNGFTKEQADQVAQLAQRLREGTTATQADIAQLQILATQYGAANAEALGLGTAITRLNAQTREQTTAVRAQLEAFQSLVTQLRAGTAVTQLQRDALTQLARETQVGKGWTDQHKAALASLTGELRVGTQATTGQVAALQALSGAFAQSTGLAEQQNTVLKESKLSMAAVAASLVALTAGLYELLKTSFEVAARVQVLGTVINVLAKNSNQNSIEMEIQVEKIKKLGITTQEARDSVIKFTQANLQLADASKLARVAQDLAVIAGVNSSQAFETLTQAIGAQHTLLLRQFGIVTSLSAIYAEYGRQVGKTAGQLDESEKKQAFLNKILSEGEKVAGAYEAAMGDVGKQMTSFARYTEEAERVLGQALLPVMLSVVTVAAEFLKWFASLDPATVRLITAFGVFATVLAAVAAALTGLRFLGLIDVMTTFWGVIKNVTLALTASAPVIEEQAVAYIALATGETTAAAATTGLSGAFEVLYVAMGPVGLALAALTILVAAGAAAYVAFGGAVDSQGEKLRHHADALTESYTKTQSQIDTIHDLTKAVDEQNLHIFKSQEEQDRYNRKVEDLNRLIPGAVSGVGQFTGVLRVNKDVINEGTKALVELNAQRLLEARSGVIEAERAALEGSKKVTDLNSKITELRKQLGVGQVALTQEGVDITAVANRLAQQEIEHLIAQRDAQEKANIPVNNAATGYRSLVDAADRAGTAQKNAAEAAARFKQEVFSATPSTARMHEIEGQIAALTRAYDAADSEQAKLDIGQKERILEQLHLRLETEGQMERATAAGVGKELKQLLDGGRQIREYDVQTRSYKSAFHQFDIQEAEQLKNKVIDGLQLMDKKQEETAKKAKQAFDARMQTLTETKAVTEADYAAVEKYFSNPNLANIKSVDDYNSALLRAKPVLDGVTKQSNEWKKSHQELLPLAKDLVAVEKELKIDPKFAEGLVKVQDETKKAQAAFQLLATEGVAKVTEELTRTGEAAAVKLTEMAERTADSVERINTDLYERSTVAKMTEVDQKIYADNKYYQNLRQQIDRQVREIDRTVLAEHQAIDKRVDEEERGLLSTYEKNKLRLDSTLATLARIAQAESSLNDQTITDHAAYIAKLQTLGEIELNQAMATAGQELELARQTAHEKVDINAQGLRDQQDALRAMGDASYGIQRDTNERIRREHSALWKTVSEYPAQFVQTVAQSFSQVLEGQKTFKNFFLDIWRSIQSELLRIFDTIIKNWLERVVAKMMTGGQTAGGGLLSGLVGGLVNPAGAATGGANVGYNPTGSVVGGGGGSGGGLSGFFDFGGHNVAGGALLAGAGAISLIQAHQAGSTSGQILSGAQTGAGIGTMIAPGIGTIIGAGIGALGGYLASKIGVSKEEKEARAKVAEFEKAIADSLTATQQLSAGTDKWKQTVTGVQDAYTQLGIPLTDANKDVAALWASSRDGGKDTEKIIAMISERLALVKDRAALLKEQGGLDAFTKKAQLAGLSVDQLNTLLKTTDMKTYKAAVEQLNDALDRQKIRLDGLSKMAEGLKTRIAGFEESIDRIFGDAANKTKVSADTLNDLLTKFGKEGGGLDIFAFLKKEGKTDLAKELEKSLPKIQAQFDRLGRDAQTQFASIVKETGDVGAAMTAIAPSLDRLIVLQKEFGLKASDSLKHLLEFRRVITTNQDVADSLSGINQELRAMTAAGLKSQETFTDLGDDAKNQFDTLINRGVAADQALLLMQPTLQALYEAQKKFGYQTDEATQSLIDMGVQNGVVGDQMQSTNDKILDILVLIGKALGADIPAALDTMASHAQTASSAAASGLDDVAGAADHAKEAVDGVSFGTSPGGIKEIPIQLALATAAAGTFADAIAGRMSDAKGAVKGVDDQTKVTGSSFQDLISKLTGQGGLQSKVAKVLDPGASEEEIETYARYVQAAAADTDAAFKGTVGSAGEVADRTRAIRDAVDKAAQAAGVYQGAIDDTGSSTDIVTGKTGDLKQAIVDAAGAYAQYGSDWEAHTPGIVHLAGTIHSGIGEVTGATGGLISRLDDSAGAFDTWRDRAVADAKAAEDAVNGVSVGHSPGGIKEIPLKLAEAQTAFHVFRDQAVATLSPVERGVDRVTQATATASTTLATLRAPVLEGHVTLNTTAIPTAIAQTAQSLRNLAASIQVPVTIEAGTLAATIGDARTQLASLQTPTLGAVTLDVSRIPQTVTTTRATLATLRTPVLAPLTLNTTNVDAALATLTSSLENVPAPSVSTADTSELVKFVGTVDSAAQRVRAAISGIPAPVVPAGVTESLGAFQTAIASRLEQVRSLLRALPAPTVPSPDTDALDTLAADVTARTRDVAQVLDTIPAPEVPPGGTAALTLFAQAVTARMAETRAALDSLPPPTVPPLSGLAGLHDDVARVTATLRAIPAPEVPPADLTALQAFAATVGTTMREAGAAVDSLPAPLVPRGTTDSLDDFGAAIAGRLDTVRAALTTVPSPEVPPGNLAELDHFQARVATHLNDVRERLAGLPTPAVPDGDTRQVDAFVTHVHSAVEAVRGTLGAIPAPRVPAAGTSSLDGLQRAVTDRIGAITTTLDSLPTPVIPPGDESSLTALHQRTLSTIAALATVTAPQIMPTVDTTDLPAQVGAAQRTLNLLHTPGLAPVVFDAAAAQTAATAAQAALSTLHTPTLGAVTLDTGLIPRTVATTQAVLGSLRAPALAPLNLDVTPATASAARVASTVSQLTSPVLTAVLETGSIAPATAAAARQLNTLQGIRSTAVSLDGSTIQPSVDAITRQLVPLTASRHGAFQLDASQVPDQVASARRLIGSVTAPDLAPLTLSTEGLSQSVRSATSEVGTLRTPTLAPLALSLTPLTANVAEARQRLATVTPPSLTVQVDSRAVPGAAAEVAAHLATLRAPALQPTLDVAPVAAAVRGAQAQLSTLTTPTHASVTIDASTVPSTVSQTRAALATLSEVPPIQPAVSVDSARAGITALSTALDTLKPAASFAAVPDVVGQARAAVQAFHQETTTAFDGLRTPQPFHDLPGVLTAARRTLTDFTATAHAGLTALDRASTPAIEDIPGALLAAHQSLRQQATTSTRGAAPAAVVEPLRRVPSPGPEPGPKPAPQAPHGPISVVVHNNHPAVTISHQSLDPATAARVWKDVIEPEYRKAVDNNDRQLAADLETFIRRYRGRGKT